jgi:hypothetical protein
MAHRFSEHLKSRTEFAAEDDLRVLYLKYKDGRSLKITGVQPSAIEQKVRAAKAEGAVGVGLAPDRGPYWNVDEFLAARPW